MSAAAIRAADTPVELSALMQPADANFMGVIHGGIILKAIDEAAGTCAYRFARKRVVTASIDRTSFHYPVQIGKGTWLHTNSAYLVYVALGDDGRPTAVPQLLVETEIERRRWAAAEERRRVRLEEREREPGK